MVLAKGNIVNANALENSDLFWALKGGGPNFGIVTRFDLYTIPLNEIWYEIVTYPVDQAPQVLEALAQWQLDCGSSDFKSNIVFEITLDYVLVGLLYAGSSASGYPDCFAPFYNLTSFTVTIPSTIGTFSSLKGIAESTVANGLLRYEQPSVPHTYFTPVRSST